MNRRFLFVCATLVALAANLYSGEQRVVPLIRGDLVSVQNGKLRRFNTSLNDIKYFALYKSASWCPPCRAFSPGLVEFYNRIKPEFPNFEVILSPGDKSEADMLAYMVGYKMAWPAVDFKKQATGPLAPFHAGHGFPHLVLVDKDGKALYEGRDLGAIEAILRSQPVESTAGKGATTQGSNFDDFFKKKTP